MVSIMAIVRSPVVVVALIAMPTRIPRREPGNIGRFRGAASTYVV